MIHSYATLSDGTLVDFEQDDEGTLTIRAGQSLDPTARPVILTLQREDANAIGLHLTGYLVNCALVSAPDPVVDRTGPRLSIECSLCDWSAHNEMIDAEGAARVEPFLRRMFLDHVERAHLPRLRTIEDVLHDQADAETAYALFLTMTTTDLELLAEAHRNDARTMTSPQGIAFCAGRQALIRHVLKHRTAGDADKP